MYLRGPLVILYVLAALLPSGASAQSGGTFTGQIIFPIYVSDVEAEHARVSQHGVPVSPIHSSSLLRRFFVPDPDGLQVFFAETAEGAPVESW